MTSNEDEDNVLYGLIAQTIEYPDDYSWVIFHLDPRARASDGVPITADDVVFSFNKFMTQGIETLARLWEGITVTKIDDLTVKFTTPQKDKSTTMQMAELRIFPKHYWKDVDLSEPLVEVPVVSGPYTISDYSMGQYVVYKRNKDYWALNHPTQKGLLNFDFVRYDMYKDDTVMLEAFKKGEYDFRSEPVAKVWITGYEGKNIDQGYIRKEEIPYSVPKPMIGFIFNVTRPQLSDRRIREAIGYLFDFEWSNTNLFYGLYKRELSYFQNSDNMARGLPQGRELEILNGFKDQLPPEVFTQEFNPPKTDGSGNIRPQLRQALSLFKQAGWQLKNGKLVDQNGQQLAFELMLWSPTYERVALPFKENLAKAGIDMSIRIIDSAQATNRLRERDYDMVVGTLGGGVYPDNMLQYEFHSKYIDSTYNNSGYTSPVVDALVEKIVQNQSNLPELQAYGKALDRVLLWQYLVVPQWYNDKVRVAYWDKFSRPEVLPTYGVGLESWWYDEEKAKKLPRRNAPN
ncbi:ABC-type oligopeptide transport system, periplasmic component [Gynuella sunshinyii YC6258]|uniref:ABC-type oligopeptide transport system, periplasmic component n=2 Tax=Gynuella sunshinyii TaxID=1445505 RepID=A0A0C5VAZ7_9GAMM|nr:ABC-type oligopeptide transport system, periplasmic component [Gynuella sunshinyii YC6258]